MTATRLPHDLLERIDRYVERKNAETPGLAFTRADAIRVLLTKALDDEETTAAKSRRR